MTLETESHTNFPLSKEELIIETQLTPPATTDSTGSLSKQSVIEYQLSVPSPKHSNSANSPWVQELDIETQLSAIRGTSNDSTSSPLKQESVIEYQLSVSSPRLETQFTPINRNNHSNVPDKEIVVENTSDSVAENNTQSIIGGVYGARINSNRNTAYVVPKENSTTCELNSRATTIDSPVRKIILRRINTMYECYDAPPPTNSSSTLKQEWVIAAQLTATTPTTNDNDHSSFLVKEMGKNIGNCGTKSNGHACQTNSEDFKTIRSPVQKIILRRIDNMHEYKCVSRDVMDNDPLTSDAVPSHCKRSSSTPPILSNACVPRLLLRKTENNENWFTTVLPPTSKCSKVLTFHEGISKCQK